MGEPFRHRPMGTTLAVAAMALGLVAANAPGSAASFDPSPVRKVEIDGARFGYRTIGEGPPLVMIMGFTGTMAEWDPALARRLSKRHRVIVFDNRGVGESASAPVAGLTIGRMADDTAAVIRKLTGSRRAHVLGWSMGSYIGQILALRHPRRVRRLVLAGADPGSPHAIQAKPAVTAALSNPDITPAELIPILYPRRAQDAGFAYIRRVPRWGLDADSLLVPPATIAAQSRAEGPLWYGRGRGAYGRLPRLDKRTLVTGGRLDIAVPPRNAKIIARRLPYSRLKLFRHAGHAFLFQLNRHFARHVKRFLSTRA